jgi:1-acyl-sn-glycerol-3-phosphate acyltransferase
MCLAAIVTSSAILWVLGALAVLVVLGMLARWLEDNPRGDAPAGLAMLVMRLYSLIFHRLRIIGRDNVPRPEPGSHDPGPLIVVANHTAGVDPILIQSALDFEVRFMMARDMQAPSLRSLWEFTGVIGVNREGADAKAAREAIRWLREGGRDGKGGVVGIFPEGGIERPPHRILPFAPGIGLLVHKSGARVLPVIIDGTPHTPTAWGSLYTRPPSGRRATLTFLPAIDYTQTKLKAAEIAADLRRKFIEATGWAANDEPDRAATLR